jgi:glutathione S-transferase
LKTSEAQISGNMTIARYLVSLAPQASDLAGKTELDRYEIEQWLSFVNTTLLPALQSGHPHRFETEVIKVG